MKVELDLSNYATKADLKNGTDAVTSKFAKKVDLANLKSQVDKVNIGNLKNVPSGLNSLKTKVDKLVPALVDLSKLSDVVKNYVVRKTEYDKLVKKANAIKTTDTSDLVKKKPDYNTKFNEIEKKITNNDHEKNITTQKFKKLTSENFAARLAQAKFSKQK